MRRVEPGRHRCRRRPLGFVAQERLVAPVAGVSPHRGRPPSHPRGAQIALRVEHGARETRDQELDHHGVVALHARRALVVLALGVKVTGARVHMRRRDHQPVRADPSRVGNAPGGEPVQVRRDVWQVGDHERDALAPAILEQQGACVQAHPIARGAATLGTVAGESHTGRRRDVGPAESRAQAGRRRWLGHPAATSASPGTVRARAITTTRSPETGVAPAPPTV